jgi:hypothetical protein
MTSPTSSISNVNVTTNYSAEDIGQFLSFNYLQLYFFSKLERIINDFYSPTSYLTIEQRQQLNTILETLQHSKLAWDFSWKLLDLNKSASAQFFGTVALCNKISKHL